MAALKKIKRQMIPNTELVPLSDTMEHIYSRTQSKQDGNLQRTLAEQCRNFRMSGMSVKLRINCEESLGNIRRTLKEPWTNPQWERWRNSINIKFK